MTQSKKKPLTDEERQAYIDKLPSEQVNPEAKEVFDEAISRAAQPQQSKPETPDSDDDYTDTQTHSHKAEDTSAKRSTSLRKVGLATKNTILCQIHCKMPVFA